MQSWVESVRVTSISISERWEGLTVNGVFPLLEWLGGSARRGVFLTVRKGTETACIKLITAAGPEADAYLSQWQVAKAMSHPDLARVLETGRCTIDGKEMVFVVTERAEAVLSGIVPRKALDPDKVRKFLEPVLNALMDLHEKGLVHGHLKPSNILRAGDQWKLSGDGLVIAGERPKIAREPAIYDAPETAEGRFTPAADVWSLGMIITEAFTQHVPESEGPWKEDPAVAESLEKPFLDIVRACLRVHPDQRCSVMQMRALLSQRVFTSAETYETSAQAEAVPGPTSTSVAVGEPVAAVAEASTTSANSVTAEAEQTVAVAEPVAAEAATVAADQVAVATVTEPSVVEAESVPADAAPEAAAAEPTSADAVPEATDAAPVAAEVEPASAASEASEAATEPTPPDTVQAAAEKEPVAVSAEPVAAAAEAIAAVSETADADQAPVAGAAEPSTTNAEPIAADEVAVVAAVETSATVAKPAATATEAVAAEAEPASAASEKSEAATEPIAAADDASTTDAKTIAAEAGASVGVTESSAPAAEASEVAEEPVKEKAAPVAHEEGPAEEDREEASPKPRLSRWETEPENEAVADAIGVAPRSRLFADDEEEEEGGSRTRVWPVVLGIVLLLAIAAGYVTRGTWMGRVMPIVAKIAQAVRKPAAKTQAPSGSQSPGQSATAAAGAAAAPAAQPTTTGGEQNAAVPGQAGQDNQTPASDAAQRGQAEPQPQSSAPSAVKLPSEPAEAQGERKPKDAAQTPRGENKDGAVLKQVMPNISSKATEGMREPVEVELHVSVNDEGTATNAEYRSQGPGNYFARVAKQSVLRWKFQPPVKDGQARSSVWTVRFRFGREETDVTATEER